MSDEPKPLPMSDDEILRDRVREWNEAARRIRATHPAPKPGSPP